MDTMADCEFAWTSFDKNAKIFEHPRNTSKKRIHPTQKPVKLYKYLLKTFAKQTDKIIDTHFGSLSIGIACHDFGCKLDACEINTKYFNQGVKQVKDYVRQLGFLINEKE